MKIPGIILFMLLSVNVFAQQLNGIVLDKATNRPIPGAVVKMGNSIQLTTIKGGFILTKPKAGDSVRVTLIGYAVYNLMLGTPGKDTIRVYLTPNTIVLNDVNIHAQRDRKIDSLQNRREFASAFNYKAPTLYDSFVKIDPSAYVPNNYIMATNNTASLVGFDMLSVIGLFSKNKTPSAKLHKQLLDQEKLDYVDERFTKEKVGGLTKLHGDSLLNFIYLYRPSIYALKQMSDYDLSVYIKKSFDTYMSKK